MTSASRTEPSTPPSHFSSAADGFGDVGVEEVAVGRQGAAQPAGGDAHLVDGVFEVDTHRRVQLDEAADLLPQVAANDVARRR